MPDAPKSSLAAKYGMQSSPAKTPAKGSLASKYASPKSNGLPESYSTPDKYLTTDQKKLRGEDRQRRVEERRIKPVPTQYDARTKAKPSTSKSTSTLGVMLDEPIHSLMTSEYEIPAPSEKGGSLAGNLSESPLAGSTLNVLEGILGSERLGYTPQDRFTPKLDAAGNVISQVAQAGFGGGTGAARLAGKMLPKAGTGGKLLATGAILGEQAQLRQQGFEDPVGNIAAAGQGAIAGVIPGGMWSTLIAQPGFDLASGAVEVSRRDPMLARRLLDGTATPEDKENAAMQLAIQTVPGLVGGLGGAAARNIQEGARGKALLENPTPEFIETQRTQREQEARLPRMKKDLEAEMALEDRQRNLPIEQQQRAASEQFDLNRAIDAERPQPGVLQPRPPEFAYDDVDYGRDMMEAERQLRERIAQDPFMGRSVPPPGIAGLLPGPPTTPLSPPMIDGGAMRSPEFGGPQSPPIISDIQNTYAPGMTPGGNEPLRMPEPLGSPALEGAPLRPGRAGELSPPLMGEEPFAPRLPAPEPLGDVPMPSVVEGAPRKAKAQPQSPPEPDTTRYLKPAPGTEPTTDRYEVIGPGPTPDTVEVMNRERPDAEPFVVQKSELSETPPGKPRPTGGKRGLSRRRGQGGFTINVAQQALDAANRAINSISSVFSKDKQPLKTNTMAREIPPGTPVSAAKWWTKARYDWMHRLTEKYGGYRHAVEAVEPNVPSDMNPYMAADFSRQAVERAGHFINTIGPTLTDGTNVGPALDASMSVPLGNGTNETVASQIDAWNEYAIARRVEDVARRNDDVGERARNGTLVPDMDAARASQIAREYEAQFPGFIEAAEKFHAFNRGMILYALDQKLISQKQADALLYGSDFYAPLNRVTDDMDNNNPFSHRLEGNERLPVVPPLVSTLNNATRIVQLADRNKANIELFQMGARNPGNGVVEPMSIAEVMQLRQREGQKAAKNRRDEDGNRVPATQEEISALGGKALSEWRTNPIKDGDNYIVSATIDGKKVYAKVDSIVYDAMMNLNPVARDWYTNFIHALGAFEGATNIQRAGITMMPGFMLANAARGELSGVAFAKRPLYKSIPGISAALSAKKQLGKTKTDAELMRLYKLFGPGFANESFVEPSVASKKEAMWSPLEQKAAQFKNQERFLEAVARRQNRITLRSPYDFFRWMGDVAEAGMRVPEFQEAYQRAIDRGASKKAAIREAYDKAGRVGLKFKRGGTWTQALNRYMLFLNPSVQGVDQLMDELRNPKVWARGTAVLGGMTAMGLAMIAQDPRKREAYLRRPDYLNHNNISLPNPRYTGEPNSAPIIDIPLTPGLQFFTTPAQVYMRKYVLEDPNWARSIPGVAFAENPDKGQAVVDGLFNTFAGPFLPYLEAFALNRDTFTGRDFDRAMDKAVDPSERYSIHSSPSMVKMSKQLKDMGVEIDPDRLEHLLEGTFQGFAKEPINLIDREVLKDPASTSRRGKTPFVDRFAREESVGLNSIQVERIFEEQQRLQGIEATLNAMKQRKEWDKMREYREVYKDALARKKFLDTTMEGIANDFKAGKGWMMRKDKTPEERQKFMDESSRRLTERAERYWKAYKNKPIQSP